MAFVLAFLWAQVTVDVRPSEKEFRVVATTPKAGDAPAFLVCRRVGTLKRTLQGMQLTEAWRQEAMDLAVERKGLWEAQVLLSRPGRYEVRIGTAGGSVSISRTGFDGWEKELRDLRAIAERVQKVAVDMDATKDFTRPQVDRWQRDLLKDRTLLDSLKTEFDAAREAIRDGIERLRHHHTLLEFAGGKLASDDEGYKVGELKRDPKGVTAARQVEGMASLLLKEGTLMVLDEFLIVMESDPEIRTLSRWKDRPAALEAMARARELLGGAEEMGTLLGEAKDVADLAGLLKRAKELRQRLVE